MNSVVSEETKLRIAATLSEKEYILVKNNESEIFCLH